ncbi:MAG: dTDP-4-dehydrorhamnose 3,5-epimerase family protein [Candidatus Omnitrophica bacterium]|nr:dTDP-4-dehydrorhamnose 3,5-epimerase family protein [Candidatus Omnitrophota bacterium]
MIHGVEVKELKLHDNDGGFFVELIRTSDPFFRGAFGQLSHSMALEGTIKAWHVHQKQTDWMYVAMGDARIGLYDMRKDSSTYGKVMMFEAGDKAGRRVIKAPPGVAHGYKVLKGPVHMIYVMDLEYDPSDIVEHDHRDPRFGYDWTV